MILNLNVNWFLYHSLLDLLLPMDKSDMKGMGSMLPELAAVFKASKLVSVNKIARVISKHKLATWYVNTLTCRALTKRYEETPRAHNVHGVTASKPDYFPLPEK